MGVGRGLGDGRVSLFVLGFLLMVRGVMGFEVWGWGCGERGRVGEVVDGRS